MTKTRHTPGPWTYHYSPYLSQFDEEIPAFEIHGEEKVCDTNEDRPREEQEANAILIATAPQLLEAAEQVIANWESGDLAEAARHLNDAVWMARGGEKERLLCNAAPRLLKALEACEPELSGVIEMMRYEGDLAVTALDGSQIQRAYDALRNVVIGVREAISTAREEQ
jgi:hypothetical protein